METKTYNKSLSARVRRRNKAGFKGEGNRSFIKKTQYGDYIYPIDNHKNDFVDKMKNHAITIGRKYAYHHIGSMPFRKLINLIHSFCNRSGKDIFEIIEEKKKKKSA